MPAFLGTYGTNSKDLDPLVSIPLTQLVILPDPVTGQLFKSTVGELLAGTTIDLSLKADLVNGKVPASQLPSFIDSVVEYPTIAALPNPGAGSTLYVITTGVDIDKIFRWSGTMYIQVGGPGYDGSDVVAEAAIRAAADLYLQGLITAEVAARITGDTNEAIIRANADTSLQSQITVEVTARQNADTTLQQNIDAEANARANADGTLAVNIRTETTARVNADAALQAQINNKLDASAYNDRYKGKYTSLAALQAAHATSNAGDYAQVDAGAGSSVINYNWDDEGGWVPGSAVGPSIASTDDLLEGAINLYFTNARAQAAVQASFDAEASARAAADNTLQTNINTEATTRANADTTLQNNINAEAAARGTADGILQTNINTEIAARIAADLLLPVKASIAEINAGTEDTKFPTSLGLEGSKYLNQSGSKISATASGTDTYTATITPAITAYASTQRFFVKFTNANTGAATLNLNGLGAIAIKKSAGTTLAAGDITAGQILCIAFDGTNFQIVGGSGSGSGGGTKASIAEINSGTEDTKFPTSLGLAGSKYTTQDGEKIFAIAAGTNTYTAVITPAITAYSAGQTFNILFTNANTGAGTLNLNSLGAKNIYRGASTALIAGDITAGQLVWVMYDGTSFQIASSVVLPTTPNKVITTGATGALQAVNDLIDVISTTSEATLVAANWSTGYATVTGIPGTKVYGLGSQYLYECSGVNTWWRTPLVKWVELYLPDVADGVAIKTQAQMVAAYPTAVQGNKVRGVNGVYEYLANTWGWVYFPFTQLL